MTWLTAALQPAVVPCSVQRTETCSDLGTSQRFRAPNEWQLSGALGRLNGA
jgi:hypothetical protein